jgi:uncharacterized RDD family membrane protein YckC
LENNEPNKTEEPEVKLVPASLLQRFVNYILDFTIFLLPAFLLLRLAAPSSNWAYTLIEKFTKKPETISLMDNATIWFVFGLYISAMETVLKGKTIAKYITGTRAVTADGLPVNSQTAFIRGLIRIIPFEQFSAISIPSRPWHDRWSNSFVVDEFKSILPKNK